MLEKTRKNMKPCQMKTCIHPTVLVYNMFHLILLR